MYDYGELALNVPAGLAGIDFDITQLVQMTIRCRKNHRLHSICVCHNYSPPNSKV